MSMFYCIFSYFLFYQWARKSGAELSVTQPRIEEFEYKPRTRNYLYSENRGFEKRAQGWKRNALPHRPCAPKPCDSPCGNAAAPVRRTFPAIDRRTSPLLFVQERRGSFQEKRGGPAADRPINPKGPAGAGRRMQHIIASPVCDAVRSTPMRASVRSERPEVGRMQENIARTGRAPKSEHRIAKLFGGCWFGVCARRTPKCNSILHTKS